MSQGLPTKRRHADAATPHQPGPALLWLPIILYLILTTGYLLSIPLGESPDEPGHLQCINQVAELGRLPQIDPRPSGAWWSREAILSGRMCYHMPLYYLLAGGLQWLAQGDTGPPMPPSNPAWNGASAAPMFDHAGKTAWYVLDEAAVITLLRGVGVLLGLLTLWATDRVTRQLWPQNGGAARLIALLLVAGWPQFLFMSRAISNDTLATALGALLLALLLQVGQPRRYLWLGLLTCLAVLTKVTMVFAVGVLLAAFLAECLLVCRHKARAYLWPGLGMSALLLALIGLLLWQPTLHSHLRLSELSFGPLRPESVTLAYWWRVLTWTVSSGWARFGWMNLAAPQWQAVLWWGIIAAAGLLGLYYAWQSTTAPARRWQVAVLIVWLLGLAAVYVRINLNRFQPQFRLILASMPALATFAAIGLAHGARRWPTGGKLLPPLLAAGLMLINGWLILGLVVPAYY